MRLNFQFYNLQNEGTQKFIDYKLARTGHFYTSLFETITLADNNNIERLRKSFPEEVEAQQNFANRVGWWESMCSQLGI